MHVRRQGGAESATSNYTLERKSQFGKCDASWCVGKKAAVHA